MLYLLLLGASLGLQCSFNVHVLIIVAIVLYKLYFVLYICCIYRWLNADVLQVLSSNSSAMLKLATSLILNWVETWKYESPLSTFGYLALLPYMVHVTRLF
ncbi:hypothetical protein PTI98_004424 [Pleurotus ostreatus]|nr:hypothetical protein PTI98_004424 [Pleurotus ostreatus]